MSTVKQTSTNVSQIRVKMEDRVRTALTNSPALVRMNGWEKHVRLHTMPALSRRVKTARRVRPHLRRGSTLARVLSVFPGAIAKPTLMTVWARVVRHTPCVLMALTPIPVSAQWVSSTSFLQPLQTPKTAWLFW